MLVTRLPPDLDALRTGIRMTGALLLVGFAFDM